MSDEEEEKEDYNKFASDDESTDSELDFIATRKKKLPPKFKAIFKVKQESNRLKDQ